ncbi:MAG: 16S rRNA (guanine(966)-N(2))-methyltransferase RsmD [Oscillospiraceae bacterium]|jgi:16S rRNA (guanine(966)-N(2))-methyltransferase RsmD|nr:16S rRNA (guanine(966)-N(2))-methyltransferase RsmD [Oscillospiraceae bacterium]
MRIISGSARGRKLNTIIDNDIKPSSDMVKEAVFNIIQFDIEGRKFLDLYAGTGQFGIEALSRGAESVVFVDSNSNATKLIYENLKTCCFLSNAKVHNREVLRFLESDEKYDCIFLDPPYDTSLVNKTINKIIEFDKLNINGIMICESRLDAFISEIKSPYLLQKEYKYGKIKIVKITRS